MAASEHLITGHELHRLRQDHVLDRTLAVLKAGADVLGVVATRSYARGDRDAYSDLDLMCFLRDEERSAQPELPQLVAAVTPTLSVLYLYDKHALYFFAKGVRGRQGADLPSGQAAPQPVRAGRVWRVDF